MLDYLIDLFQIIGLVLFFVAWGGIAVFLLHGLYRLHHPPGGSE